MSRSFNMGTEPAIIEISSDDEEFGLEKSCSTADWLNSLLDCVDEGKNLDDVTVLEEFSSSPAIQEKKTAAPRVGKGVVRDDLDDDCLVLEGDPDKPVAIAEDERGGDGDDLLIVGQKGQIACRDYPHARYLCANFPFDTTPHEKSCALCHCYVCDSPAPCIYWGDGFSSGDHCHSTDKEARWKADRKEFKQRTMAAPIHRKLPNITPPMMATCHNSHAGRLINAVPVPTQALKSNSLLPCSATRVAHGVPLKRRPHVLCSVFSSHGQRLGHHLAKSSPLTTGTQCIQRERLGGGPLDANVVASHPSHKRARSARSSPVSTNAPRLQCIVPNQNWMYQAAPQKSQSPTVMSIVDTAESWKEILASVASELGVADGTNECTTAGQQPEAVSSQATAFPQCTPLSSSYQNTGLYACSTPATINPFSLHFDSTELNGTTAQDAELFNIQQLNPLVPQNISATGECPLLNIFPSLAQDVEAAKEVVPSQLDPASLLYDFDSTWNGLTQA